MVEPQTAFGAKKILLVEDSRLFASVVRKKLEAELGAVCERAASLLEAKEILAGQVESFAVALLDLNLPDAPNGEIVDFVCGQGIPSIVFTAEMSEELRNTIWSKRIVDYVLKESTFNLDYIVSLVQRIIANPERKVLVVDDSLVIRSHLANLLQIHCYQVFTAANGQEALVKIEEHPDIKLVITDYNMPVMDGFELINTLRRKHTKEQLAIIGVSGQGSNFLSASFLKKGANDFLTKPFLVEEFYSRVMQQIDFIEHVALIQQMSNMDFLTKLNNRRFFFEVGAKLHASAIRGSISLTAAMLDVDFFKKINDTYSHAAGDQVLKALAELLRQRFRRSDVVARFGGEEFCILAPNMAASELEKIFEGLRQQIENLQVTFGGQTIRFTASIGVCPTTRASLEDMIHEADTMLYQAKKTGRNKVVVAPLA